jgi:hypothetical protein
VSPVHLALLGDSMFDNGIYLESATEATAYQTADLMGAGGTCTLLAVDGAATESVARQLLDVDDTVTHVAVSVGGNDCLRWMFGARSLYWAMTHFGEFIGEFRGAYGRMLAGVAARNRSTALCTVWMPGFTDPSHQAFAVEGLPHVNAVIREAARQRGMPVVELVPLCCDPEDYANQIEPSAIGGRKIGGPVLDALGIPRREAREGS